MGIIEHARVAHRPMSSQFINIIDINLKRYEYTTIDIAIIESVIQI